MSASRSVEERLAAARQRYGDALHERLAEIQQAHNKAALADFQGEPLTHYHRLTHTLAGTAGTFGFHAVGEGARVLERILKIWVRDPEISEEQKSAWERALRTAINNLKEIILQATADHA